MIRLSKSLSAWGTPGFENTFKAEIEQLGVEQLPLQQGLTTGSYVTDSPRKVLVHGLVEKAEFIQVTAGIFYSGIIAGCNCADDPTPVDEVNEYCEVLIEISKQTAEVAVTLLISQDEN